uniref:Uncharacterized protein n=2 Tax=Caenorhabditis japonica TaxID=281687 RepID=A0A8R1E747_CAEJA
MMHVCVHERNSVTMLRCAAGLAAICETSECRCSVSLGTNKQKMFLIRGTSPALRKSVELFFLSSIVFLIELHLEKMNPRPLKKSGRSFTF